MVNGSTLRIVIVASAGGSVMDRLLNSSFFKSQIFSVVSDRSCPAIDKAQSHGVPTKINSKNNKKEFCDDLLVYLQDNKIDYVISFFTKLFVGNLLNIYQDRILNMHPSLLPAFKGLKGFESALRYGTRYVGTTIHFIDDSMDEGKIILQSIYPVNPGQSENSLRHRIFGHQCKSLLQVVKWLSEGRIHIKGNYVVISGGKYIDFEFSPNLDFTEAKTLTI